MKHTALQTLHTSEPVHCLQSTQLDLDTKFATLSLRINCLQSALIHQAAHDGGDPSA